MQKLTQSELKSIQLDILDQVAAFCDNNKIEYFIFAGTLIGAARHKGFIPWDDDIDICMRRAEYDRFFREFIPEDSHLKALNFRKDSNFFLSHGKVIDTRTVLLEHSDNAYPIGVNIDVFPMDNLPSNEAEIIKLDKALKPWRNALTFKLVPLSKNRSFIKNLCLLAGKVLLTPVSMSHILKKIDHLARRYENHNDCTMLGDISVFTYGMREALEMAWFSETVDLEFEGRYFKAPAEYDLVLKHMYGDYMKLPPEEKRVSHHGFDAYWK